jgi:hypothetical protein
MVAICNATSVALTLVEVKTGANPCPYNDSVPNVHYCQIDNSRSNQIFGVVIASKALFGQFLIGGLPEKIHKVPCIPEKNQGPSGTYFRMYMPFDLKACSGSGSSPSLSNSVADLIVSGVSFYNRWSYVRNVPQGKKEATVLQYTLPT